MKYFKILLGAAFLQIFFASVNAQSILNKTSNIDSSKSQNNNKKDTLLLSKTHKAIDITKDDSDTNACTFFGNKIIELKDTVRNNVIVKAGNLTVFGMVDGNVLVMGGDLLIRSTGRITGDVRVIDGKIIKDSSAVITGYEDITDTLKTAYREKPLNFIRFENTFEIPWQYESGIIDKFVFRYNRVESIFIGLGREKKYYWDGEHPWSAYGSIGWGFKSHTWRGNLGLSRQFVSLSEKGSNIIEVGVEGYSLTDTKDQWIISSIENTASAFLIHEDFRDYFEREGATIHAAYYVNQKRLKSELSISYLADTYDSLQNRVDWALFGGHKKFRTNPAINPGRMRSLLLIGGISTVRKMSSGSEGWCVFASIEAADRSWGSEFDFYQYILDVRRYQKLNRYANFNARLRFGTSSGTLPEQKLFELGGMGTMDAYPFKSEYGNRMMLINMELIFKGSVLDELEFNPIKIFSYVNFMFISDAGFTRNAFTDYTMQIPPIPTPRHAYINSALDGFSDLKWNEFKHDFGIALAHRSGNFRIGITWRTDRSESVRYILRFSRPF